MTADNGAGNGQPKMKCPNVKECPCPSAGCQNYGKCCACTMHHRQNGGLPWCLRK